MTLHRRDGVSSAPAAGGTVTRDRSAVVHRIGGRQYPARSDPRCHVCQSEYRVEIERALIRSYGHTAIWRSLPPKGQEALSVRNIAEHARRHLPLDHAAKNAIVEARAREIGLDLESAEQALVDHVSFAKVGLQDVYERIRDGRLSPDVKDGIAFANLLLKVEEQAGGGVDQDAYVRGFMVYMKAIKSVCTPDQLRQISAHIAADPLMKGLLARTAPVVEGETDG